MHLSFTICYSPIHVGHPPVIDDGLDVPLANGSLFDIDNDNDIEIVEIGSAFEKPSKKKSKNRKRSKNKINKKTKIEIDNQKIGLKKNLFDEFSKTKSSNHHLSCNTQDPNMTAKAMGAGIA